MNAYVAMLKRDVPKGVACVTYWCDPAVSERTARQAVDEGRGDRCGCVYIKSETDHDDAVHPDAWCVVRRDLLPESHPEHRVVMKTPEFPISDRLRQAAKNFNFGHESPQIFGDPIIISNKLPHINITIYADECSDAALLDGYTQSQREGSKVSLTPDQKERASLAWSAALRAKVTESSAAERERERLKVVVDRDDDGE